MTESLVLAVDYRVATPERWWAAMRNRGRELREFGARHEVIYQALDDPDHVFVTVGLHDRALLDAVLRSGATLQWFDAAGVEEIPPLFVGEVVEKIDLVSGDDEPPGVLVAGVSSVPDFDRYLTQLHAELPSLAAAGVRKLWIYRALDNGLEVMIMRELDTPGHASRWGRYPERFDEWMAGVGIGVYPPLFIGTLAEIIEPEVD